MLELSCLLDFVVVELVDTYRTGIKPHKNPIHVHAIVKVFDVFEGEKLGENKKSVGIGLILQHPSRTLIDSEVNNSIGDLTNKLEKQFKAKLRD